MAQTRIRVPKTAKPGQVVEIRTLAMHPMVRGGRNDATGVVTPRRIIHRFRAVYGGEEIFRMDLSQGIATNPYIEFTTVARETGDIVFEWHEDGGAVFTKTARLTVQ